MPRSSRSIVDNQLYHLTHRCHNGSFLFRFACDRSDYRKRLRKALDEYKVSLLDFSITSNHDHLLVMQNRGGSISNMMQRLDGDFAASYNRRKHRKGPFFEDRFHNTSIECGEHLDNCMVYIDLNMVRAGVVCHPREWQWCGYNELLGERTRYTVIDFDRVLEQTGFSDIQTFREYYAARVQEEIDQKRLSRQPQWTSIAVGSEAFVKRIAEQLKAERPKFEVEQVDGGAWVLRESWDDYRAVKRLSPERVRRRFR
jgi:putative transposase